MLKMFFAEDDAAIRESIIRNVKWEQYGYEFAGQAPDGETAYSGMQLMRPDVLLTDLKMPFMDGLQLSRLVRKEMPDVKIIMLTGYGDFESVQEALNMGVAKFILKPVTLPALVETISEVRDMIHQERETRAQRELRAADTVPEYENPIEKAQDYIRARYGDEDISLITVAKHVNLSPAHFSTVFSRNAGKTFMEFLTQVRMDRAKELLAHSSKRSSEIAVEVGYKDSQYFSFAFKKATGCSPREYRNKVRGEGDL